MISTNRSKPVRLVAPVDPPLVNECFDRYPDNCPEAGYEAEYAFTVVHDILNLSVEWIRVESFEEMYQYMDEDRADMIASSLFVDPSLGDKWGYAPPYLWDGTALIAKETIVDKSESLLLIGQFAFDLWGAMAAGTVVIVLIHLLGVKLHYAHRSAFVDSNKSLKCKKLLALLSYCFNVKLLYGCWFLFISIMLNFYGNLMAVDLLHSGKKRTVPFQSMDELGDKLLSRECRLAILDVYLDDDEFHGTIINPSRHNRSWAQKFRDAYVINKPYYVPTREELAELILNSTCVVGADWWTIKQFFVSRWCDLRFIIYDDEPVMFYQYAFYTTRNDLKDAVNTVISSDALQAFPSILANKYFYSGYMPACESIDTAHVTPLTLAKLQDGFYLYVFGLLISLCIVSYQNYKLKRLHILPEVVRLIFVKVKTFIGSMMTNLLKMFTKAKRFFVNCCSFLQILFLHSLIFCK